MSRLTEEELAEIRARHEQGEVIFDDRHLVHVDRRKLLAELEVLRAERDAAMKCVACESVRDVERRGWEACREAARQRLAEEARAFLVEVGPSDAARIAMDCMRHAEDVVATLQPGTARAQGSQNHDCPAPSDKAESGTGGPLGREGKT